MLGIILLTWIICCIIINWITSYIWKPKLYFPKPKRFDGKHSPIYEFGQHYSFSNEFGIRKWELKYEESEFMEYFNRCFIPWRIEWYFYQYYITGLVQTNIKPDDLNNPKFTMFNIEQFYEAEIIKREEKIKEWEEKENLLKTRLKKTNKQFIENYIK